MHWCRDSIADRDDPSDCRAHRSRRAQVQLPPHRRLPRPRAAGARRPASIAVVKANAYGHGAGQVARALEDAGADLLACADIEEGAALRAAGVRAEILVFGALSVSDLDGLFDCRLTPTISTPGAARAVQAAAAAIQAAAPLSPEDRHRHEPPRVPLRQPAPDAAGAAGQREPRARRRLHALRHGRRSRARRCSTSSACVSSARCATSTRSAAARATATPQQRRAAARFARVVRPRPARACCSTASCRRRSRRRLPLTPVMTLGSRVVAVKGMRPGEGVGYGAQFTADRPTTIAIVPAGYADGLDMRLAGRGAVLIRGRRAPIVGSVCMDMLMADVTGLDVSPGDEVVIIGSQQRPSARSIGSTCARWPRSSARFRGRWSAGSARDPAGLHLRVGIGRSVRSATGRPR